MKLAAIATVVAISVGASACGSSSDGSASTAPNYRRALAGAPAPLAALYKQGNQLLDGGLSAFRKRIGGLRGHPAVVNVWGSWCGPCREEFPIFQKGSAAMGKRVAFLGVDSYDNDDAAATFLADNPVPYPSYKDPDKDITDYLDSSIGLPGTAFFDRRGKRTYTHHGPYGSVADLRADIQRYAVGGPSG